METKIERAAKAVSKQAASDASNGVSFFSLLGITFITLKLCKVIDWSWWWVTAPLWGPYAALLLMLAGAGVGLSIFGAIVFLYEKLVVDRRYAKLAKKLKEDQ